MLMCMAGTPICVYSTPSCDTRRKTVIMFNICSFRHKEIDGMATMGYFCNVITTSGTVLSYPSGC